MNKNTIPLIIIVIAVICFGLAGLVLVIHDITKEKCMHDAVMDSPPMLETESHHHEPDGTDDADPDSLKY